MTRKLLIVAALTACVAAQAQAQLCAGTASFSAGHMRAGFGAEFPAGARAYGAGLPGATRARLFGGQIMRSHPTGAGERRQIFRRTLGTRRHSTARKTASARPPTSGHHPRTIGKCDALRARWHDRPGAVVLDNYACPSLGVNGCIQAASASGQWIERRSVPVHHHRDVTLTRCAPSAHQDGGTRVRDHLCTLRVVPVSPAAGGVVVASLALVEHSRHSVTRWRASKDARHRVSVGVRHGPAVTRNRSGYLRGDQARDGVRCEAPSYSDNRHPRGLRLLRRESCSGGPRGLRRRHFTPSDRAVAQHAIRQSAAVTMEAMKLTWLGTVVPRRRVALTVSGVFML